jgi:enoyl-CoA hydratase/carnithine racemase
MGELEITRPSDGVALVTLNRPHRRNALNDDLLLNLLPGAVTSLQGDADVRVIVVTGVGESFSSGADLTDCSGFNLDSRDLTEEWIRRAHQGGVDLWNLPKPKIAAINGAAVGAGLGLALACDIRIAAPTARMGAPFVAMGLVPDYGITFHLPRIIGATASLDLLWTGRLIGAEEALELHLVSRIAQDAVSVSLDLAANIASMPTGAVNAIRQNVYQSMDVGLEAVALLQEPRSQSEALHGHEFKQRFADYRRRVQARKA